MVHRIQLTTDGHKPYLEAVEGAFGMDVDFAQLVKLYGAPQEPDKTYSPAKCIGTRKHAIMGRPDPRHCDQSCAQSPGSLPGSRSVEPVHREGDRGISTSDEMDGR